MSCDEDKPDPFVVSCVFLERKQKHRAELNIGRIIKYEYFFRFASFSRAQRPRTLERWYIRTFETATERIQSCRVKMCERASRRTVYSNSSFDCFVNDPVLSELYTQSLAVGLAGSSKLYLCRVISILHTFIVISDAQR